MNKKIRIVDYTRKGKKTRYEYLNLTKWQIFKRKVSKFFKKLFLVVVFVSITVAVFKMGEFVNKDVVVSTSSPVMIDSLKIKVESLKQEVVAQIKKGETMTASEEDALITFDPYQKKTRGEASIGSYQYKVKTVQHYYKKLYNQVITPKEAVLIALDDDKAQKLTYDVVFKADGLSNWLNTSKKFDLKTKVAIIKSLEQ